MKKKILSICTLASVILFILSIGLYAFALIADPQTHMDNSGIHWPNITIKHNPLITVTNYPSSNISTNYPLYKRTFVEDPSVHVTVMKDNWSGNLMFFNQRSPNVVGMLILTGGHNSTNYVDRSISEKGWDGFGIYFCLIEDMHQPDSWWTLEISLWYPIVIFGILPAIFVVKKLRCKRLAPKQ